jgi:NCAIR mutase (PurE)-related protein
MDRARLENLLRDVQAGNTSVDDALGVLRDFPYETVGDFARLDTHRALRTGYPEVVFSQNKTPDQCAQIARRLRESAGCVLLTRANRTWPRPLLLLCPPAT